MKGEAEYKNFSLSKKFLEFLDLMLEPRNEASMLDFERHGMTDPYDKDDEFIKFLFCTP